MEENRDVARAPRLLGPIVVLGWGWGWESMEPSPAMGCRFTLRAWARAGSRLLLPALLYIERLTHSSPSQLQPDLSKAAMAPQGLGLGLGLGHGRVYFRHLNDTLQGHWSGRVLCSPLISGP